MDYIPFHHTKLDQLTVDTLPSFPFDIWIQGPASEVPSNESLSTSALKNNPPSEAVLRSPSHWLQIPIYGDLKAKIQVTYMVSIIPIYGDLKAKVQVTYMVSIIPIYGDLKAKVQVTYMVSIIPIYGDL